MLGHSKCMYNHCVRFLGRRLSHPSNVQPLAVHTPLFQLSTFNSMSTDTHSSSITSLAPNHPNFSSLEYMKNHLDFTGAGTTGTIFSDTAPVTLTADLLSTLKDLDGLTWVGVIITSTLVLRCIVGLPIIITQQRSMARLEALKPKLDDLVLELKKETTIAVRKFNWDKKTATRQYRKSFKAHWRKLVEEHNCHPMRSLCLGLLQVPVWISFSSAIRNIVFGLPLPRTEEMGVRWLQIHEESLPWIANLTSSDPLVLPLVFLTANLINLGIHHRNRPGMPKTIVQKVLPWILTGGIVGISVCACFVPAAVTLYWATSSSVALLQNIILLHPKLRKALKMPVHSVKSQPVESKVTNNSLRAVNQKKD